MFQALKEYIKLIPTIWDNKEKIVEGILNQVKNELHILPEDQQAEIARRRVICAGCPFNSSNAVVQSGYDMNGRFDEHCIMCGCTITRKTSSLSSFCGITCCNAEPLDNCKCKKTGLKEYNELNKVNMPLKWASYKTNKDEHKTEDSN